jgi:hypothetical protein
MKRRTKALLGVTLSFALMCVNLPTSFAAAPAAPQRVLVDAPDPPAITSMAPTTIPQVTSVGQGIDISAGVPTVQGAATRQTKTQVAPAPLTHVKKLGASAVAAIEKANSTTVTTAEGRLTASFTGKDGLGYQLVLEDGVLKSGLQVVAISVVSAGAASNVAQATAKSLFRLPVTTAAANTSWFLRCSYATQNGYYGDLYVHLCAIDVFLVSGVLAVLAALIGGLVGALIGNAIGAVVGLGVGTILALIALYFLWQNMAWDGSVSFTVPHWTMMPPFGGNIYINSSGRWVYMWNQCWILYLNHYYDTYC